MATAFLTADEAERVRDPAAGRGELEAIRHHLTIAGRHLGRAEVIAYPIHPVAGRLSLERVTALRGSMLGRWGLRGNGAKVAKNSSTNGT